MSYTGASARVFSTACGGLATLILPPKGGVTPRPPPAGAGVSALGAEGDKGQRKAFDICLDIFRQNAKNSSEEGGRLRPLPSLHRVGRRLEDRAPQECDPSARAIRGISPGSGGKPSDPLF